MSHTSQPIVCLCPASEFRNCSDTECPNSGANAAEPVDEDDTRELVARIRDRINDAPMPTEHLLDEAAEAIECLMAALKAKPETVRTYPPSYPGGHWKATIVALEHIGDPVRPYAYVGSGETEQAAIDHLNALEAADTWSAENAKQA